MSFLGDHYDEHEEGSSIEAEEIGNPEPVINKVWKPTEKQQEVLSIPDTIFEACGGGAAGGGKTDLGIMLPLARQFTEHPKFKALVMRRTLTDLEKEIIPREHEWYGGSGAVYNENKKVWKFPSGARIQNGHAEREQDVRKYDSAEYNYIDWDESTHFSEFQYLYLSVSRCRSSSPDLPAIVRSFTNPGNIGHGFFKKRFVEPNRRGREIIRDRITGLKRIYIPFLGIDNPHLIVNDPAYLKRLEALPEAEKRAKLYGDWDSYEGQVFSEFRVLHISDEPDNALHVINPFPIPEWWPRLLCIDWGFDAMTFAIWAAISPSGRVYIYRTYNCTRLVINVWSQDVVNLTGDETIEDLVICHSAGQHRGEEKTIQEQIQEAFQDRFVVRLADKDRIGGKALIHEYLRWKQRPTLRTPEIEYNHELACKILRQQGEIKYNEYLNLFLPQEEEINIPKMQIFSHSPEGIENKELIDVIPACIPAEHNPEDVEEFKGDDPYDCLRIVVKAAHRYVGQSADAQAKREKIQKVLDALQKTQNQTAYYRSMEKLEQDTQESFSVPGRRRIGNRRYTIR